MQSKQQRFGPIALTTSLTTNLLNPPTLTGGVGVSGANTYILLKRLRIINKTGSSAKFSLYIGATGANAAGSEFMGTGTSVAANSANDWASPGLRFDVADFLVGGSDTSTALTIQGEYEIGIA